MTGKEVLLEDDVAKHYLTMESFKKNCLIHDLSVTMM